MVSGGKGRFGMVSPGLAMLRQVTSV